MRLFRTIGLSSFFIFSSFSLFSLDYVQLGSGTSSSSSNTITPWTTFFEDGRKQLLFTASELSAAGLNVGDEINALAFDIVSANAHATNLTIGLKSTTQTTFSAFAFESGFSTYFSGTHTPSTGWDQISFSSNYVWDGNGIIVEFCYNNSSFTGNSTINYTTTSHTSNRYAYTDGNDGCVLSSFGSNSNRANVRFYLDKPSLLSIERNSPASASTTSTNMQFQLSFSTDVALLDTADISLNGSAAANTSIQSVSRVNGAQYLVDVLTSNPSTGMIGLDIKGVDASGSNNIIADNSVLDQQALNDIQVTNSPEFGQSFVAGASGPLLKVVLRTGYGHSYSGSGVMEIRSGSGLGGTVLASENVTIPSGPLFTDIFFYFSNPVTLSSGSTYTLRFNFPGASSSNLAVSAQTGNPYANGILYQPAALSSADLYFKTYIAPSIVPLTTNLPATDESYQFVVCNLGSNVTLNQGANCEGENGSATVSGSNGQMPYTYSWGNGENTATAVNLEYGTTALTITDALGCTATSSASIGSDCSIRLKGNGQLIFNNQTTVSTSDSTNFGATGVGSTTSVNYTIVNRSAGGLTIDSVRIGGVDPTDFSLTQTPAGSINAGDSTSFTVEFAPTGYGTKDATIQIYNTSADAPSYAFNIRGVASHNGLNFDGINDFAEVADNNALDFTNAFTLEAWVNPDVLTTSGLITKFGNGSSNRSFALLLLSNGTLEFSFSSNGSSENYIGSAGSIQSGVWSHIAAVYDGSTMKIYINGVQDPNTLSISGNVFNSTMPLLLGARNNGSIGLQFNGTLDEVRLWNVAKTAADIANNKNCQLQGSENNLAAYYDFNQGTPGGNNSAVQHVLDRTANGLSAQIINLSLTNSSSSNFIVGASDSVDVCTQPINLSVMVDSNVSCNGLSDGGATVSVSGGTMPYTYLWNNTATTASITGVLTGNYSVTVTDNNGLTDSASVTITEPAVLVAATVIDSNVSCNGGMDGGATASATGGTMPYTYSWSNSATTSSITGVVAGTYTVTITDNNGCTSTSGSSISEPAAIGSTIPITACGSYTWMQNGQTYNMSGMYYDSIPHIGGCDSIVTLDLTIINLTVSILEDSLPVCYGSSDAGVSAIANGGIAPYTYAWSNSATTSSLTGITAGTYSVIITDANACTTTASKVLSDPDPTIYSSQVIDAICENELNGQISVEVLSGTWPNKVTWSNGEVDSLSVIKAQDFEGNASDNWGYSDTTYLEDCTPVQRYYSIIPYEVDTATNVVTDVDGRAPYTIYAPTVDDVISTYGYSQVDQGSYSNATYFSPYYSSMQDRINLAFFNQGKDRYLMGLFDVPGEDPTVRVGGTIDFSIKNYPSSGNQAQLVLIDDPADVSVSGKIDSMDSFTYNPATGEAIFSFDWLPETSDGFIYGPLTSDSILFSILSTSVSNRLAFLGYKDAPTNSFGVHKTRTTTNHETRTKIYSVSSGQCVNLPNNGIESSYTLGSNVSIGNASSGANYLSQLNQTTFDTTTRRVITFDPVQLDTASNSAISLNYYTNNLESDWDSVWYEIKYDSSSNWTNANSARLDLNSNGWKNLQVAIPQGESIVHFRMLSVTDDTNDLMAFDEVKIQSLTIGLDSIKEGNYSFNAIDKNGCSSLASFVVGFTNRSSRDTILLSACTSYTWPQNGMTYSTSGIYKDTIPNAAGCDSVITLNLTINNTVRDTNSVVACDSYTWASNGMMYTTSGIYSDTLMAANGCDSISSIDLTLSISTSSMQVVTNCDSYLWMQNGMTYSTSGMYRDTIPNAAGCDSIITLDLTINNTIRDTNAVVACDSYVWLSNGLTYNTSGIYSDTLMAANGCDSISSIDLTINPSTSSGLTISTCDNYTWPQNGMTYTATGMYNDTIPNAAGCDSVITLDLTINNTVRDTNVVVACDNYTWSSNGMQYTTSGIYSDTLMATNGCDSISSIDLTINLSTSTTLSMTSCDSYLWSQNGMTYNTSGMYKDTIPNTVGCDSIITLDLTINNTVRDTNAVTACDSYTWMSNNQTYTMSGIYSDTLMAANGCDSISSIDLTINISTSTTLSMTSCDSYTWMQNGMTYTMTGMYNDTVMNAAGCDSIIILDLTINSSPIADAGIDQVICNGASVVIGGSPTGPTGSSYQWDNASTLSSSATANPIASPTVTTNYTVTVTDVSTGCTGTDQILVTVNNASSSIISQSACDSFTWGQNGQTYTMTGMYNDTIANSVGCDSVITLDLTINPSTSSGLTISTCDTYTWPQNGMTYTQSGLFNDTIPNALGCDSIITLDLTINHTVRDTNAVAACDSYTWMSNNQTYTMSGIYSDTLMAANGCDSISSIDLTINLSTSATINVTSCDSYTWMQNGMTYTISGMYNDTVMNAVGCDSIVTLNLTIDTADIRVVRNGFDLIAQASGGNVSYQWIDCANGNTVISGATSDTLNITQNGSYAVVVTQFGCVDTSVCINVINVGITDVSSLENKMLVYPNPAKDLVNVELAKYESGDVLELYDLKGKRIAHFEVKQKRMMINISEYAEGLYFLKYRNKIIKLVLN